MTNEEEFNDVASRPDPDAPEKWWDGVREGRLNLDEPRFAPHPHECLPCYLLRMTEHGCARHQFTQNYQRIAAPRATALLERLGRSGGCCCECEVLWNVYAPNLAHVEVDDAEQIVGAFPECLGVRSGSTQSCDLWVRRGR